jgi:hybrid cluster-associated redox disulfide protein
MKIIACGVIYEDMTKKISKETLIEDLVKDHPTTVKVFTRHKLPCIVCGEPLWGTVGENAERYGADLEALLSDLRAEAEASK